jgi:hypothetical protein
LLVTLNLFEPSPPPNKWRLTWICKRDNIDVSGCLTAMLELASGWDRFLGRLALIFWAGSPLFVSVQKTRTPKEDWNFAGMPRPRFQNLAGGTLIRTLSVVSSAPRLFPNVSERANQL